MGKIQNLKEDDNLEYNKQNEVQEEDPQEKGKMESNKIFDFYKSLC